MAGKSPEEVVTAATQVFFRYGFKRTTMGDLAEAAHMSRPALYLVFPSKEELFTAVIARLLAASLAEIRAGVARLATPLEQLVLAFDVWSVRPFELVLSSPDARDLYESSYVFASDVMTRSADAFVAIVAGVLEPLVRAQAKVGLSSVQLARMLASAIPGFKTVAKTREHFREMIDGMLTVTLASLAGADEHHPPRKSQARKAKKTRRG